MTVMEVLTLLLVIFAALSYLDNHKIRVIGGLSPDDSCTARTRRKPETSLLRAVHKIKISALTLES